MSRTFRWLRRAWLEATGSRGSTSVALPTEFLEHLRLEGYDPRSNKNSNSLAVAIARDLARTCPSLGRRALSGELVYDLNFDLRVRTSTWNVDLVLGRTGDAIPPEDQSIRKGRPTTVEVAIEIKSIMTRHHNNAKNRKRDLEAHHDHVHQYDQQAIAGGVFVVNPALTFLVPRSDERNVHATDHRRAVFRKCIECFLCQNVCHVIRDHPENKARLCFIVVEMDNENLESTAYIERAPAPLVGVPLNYDSFLQRICGFYERRYP